MKREHFGFLLLMLVAIVLATAGCAGKHKPDADQNMANSGIQNEDLAFDDQGSDSGKINGLQSIHFEYDKSALTTENRQILTADAQWMKAHPKQYLQIEGHCDRTGTTEYNLALGQRRADGVKGFLTALGVPGSHLSTISYGKERLLDTAETPEADAHNRRANFKPVGNTNLRQASQ